MSEEERRRKSINQKRYRLKIRNEAIEAYGGKCIDCNSEDKDTLEFDHDHGHGNEHRHEIFGYGHASPGGWNFYLALRKLGFPKDLGIVLRCTKCHDIKHPHRGNPFGKQRRRIAC